MKKLLLTALFICTCILLHSQDFSKLDNERGYSNFKLGKYYLDYRMNLTLFGTIKNEKVYKYSISEKLIFGDVTFDEILLWFNTNDQLVKITFSKFCNSSWSDECFDEFKRLIQSCIQVYSNQCTRKDYKEDDSTTFSTIWNGSFVMLELFYTLQNDKTKGGEISVYFSLK